MNDLTTTTDSPTLEFNISELIADNLPEGVTTVEYYNASELVDKVRRDVAADIYHNLAALNSVDENINSPHYDLGGMSSIRAGLYNGVPYVTLDSAVGIRLSNLRPIESLPTYYNEPDEIDDGLLKEDESESGEDEDDDDYAPF